MAAYKVKKAIIPVAGLGTRGLPFTKEVPKELTPILDTPAIQHIMEEVSRAGIEQVILVTGKGKFSIEDHFDYSAYLEHWLHKRGKDELIEKLRQLTQMCEVVSIRQKEPLGLGHAVYTARNLVGNEPFAVCLGDEIYPPWNQNEADQSTLKRLIEVAEAKGGSAIVVKAVEDSEVSSYGIIDLGGEPLSKAPLKVKGLIEKPDLKQAPSRLAVIGRYVFSSQMMDYLADAKPGRGGEIQLTDAMDRYCRSENLYALMLEGCRYDIGSLSGLVQATLDASLRREDIAPGIRRFMRERCESI